uniref:Uncharacterized protein n=1 Tax=Cacopsylla melanoneura TaxID=428564 RepID=A0A8D9DMK9_9HEMI
MFKNVDNGLKAGTDFTGCRGGSFFIRKQRVRFWVSYAEASEGNLLSSFHAEGRKHYFYFEIKRETNDSERQNTGNKLFKKKHTSYDEILNHRGKCVSHKMVVGGLTDPYVKIA